MFRRIFRKKRKNINRNSVSYVPFMNGFFVDNQGTYFKRKANAIRSNKRIKKAGFWENTY